MKRIALFFAFALAVLSAQAQTTINITSQTCNVANTECVLQGDGGQVITFNPTNPSAAPMLIDGAPYTMTDASTVLVSATLYKRVSDVTYTFSPSAVMDATHIAARSGSGRGGWAWHPHWQFLSVTVY